ncbi:putative mucin/carbohydrate-binding domain-containing protein [Listeria booriae]|uniref:putative mucin/carbohydrate-binding domain-containing protein n=1 Tax=Listeria booriae TaxID=1552123 RepID=UPI0016272D0A|nr:putative mucin/carbohydrate-binding domain-containing protein [Listeria booriae]MBC1800813.1 enhancing factor (viral) [Listeria booriae]
MKNKKGYALFIAMVLMTIIGVVVTGSLKVNAATTMEKKMYTLENPTWLRAEGFSKGMDHDRQDLGIIVPKDSTIEIRQTNPNYKGSVTLELLNDDRNTEKSISVGSSWITATASVDSVPFVKTTFTAESPILEYKVDDKVIELPVFKQGDKEADFFGKWDKSNTAFALIGNKYLQILVPARDKSYLKNMDEFSSINDLLAYYDTLFETYNELAGISFTAEKATDKNVPTKYFAKADKHGPGSGYYGGSYTGESSGSVAGFWLHPWWGGLHEIAHGYQGYFMSDPTFSVSEVWNNIYADSMQKKTLGNDYYKEGWVYRNNRPQLEGVFENFVYETKTPANSWDVRSKLYMLILMKDKAGDKAFAHFNQSYRAAVNAGTINYEEKLLDLMTQAYGETSKYDFTPFIELVQGSMSDNQKVENLYSGNKAVYPLASLLSGNNLKQARKDIQLDSKWGLVSNNELAKYKLTTTSDIQFTINDFNQIKGKTLRIKDGTDVIRSIKITAPTITLKNMPVGIYSLDIPTGGTRFYKPSTNYLVVSDGENKTNIQMNELQTSTVASELMVFKGLSNNTFAKATVDPEAGKFQLDITNGNPHVYFTGRYAAVEILDETGQSVFNKVMKGVSTETGKFEATIKPGYTIKVIHEEPSRFSIVNASPNLLEYAVTSTYKVTKYGLANEKTKVTEQNALTNYKEKLEKLAEYISSNPAIKDEDYANPKTQLKKAIDYLPDTDTDKIKYQQNYADLLAIKNDKAQNLANGEKFRFEIQGLGSSHFANIDLDLVTNKAKITNATKAVHVYFNDVYASVKIHTSKGKQVFSKEYIGNKTVPASTDDVNIGVGYYITITHQEPSRLIFTNTETKEIYHSYYMEQTYVITEDGLQKVDTKQIPTADFNERDGSNFQFEFQGLGNAQFAVMTLNLTNKQAKIKQNTRQPHSYFSNTYASIEIRDARGKIMYKKDYNGQERLTADAFNVKIDTGYYITITHQEPSRLIFTNTETKETYNSYYMKQTYVITEDGLVKVEDSQVPTFSPNYIDGELFQFKFQGLSYWNFANVTVDLASMELTFDKKAGKPHVYFDKNYPYATLQVKDKEGSEVYNYTMIGNEDTGALLKKLALEQGYYLIITHQEAKARLPLTVDNVPQEGLQNQMVYQIGANGLVKKALTDIPTPNRFVNQKIYSSDIDFTFKGYADRQFAKLHVNKEKNMLHLDVNAIQPHYVFGATPYASITVKDDKGNVVFTKDFIGNVTQQAASLDIPIKEGYTIQVNHREPSTIRLEVKDNENDKVYQMTAQNEFLVAPNGLIVQ